MSYLLEIVGRGLLAELPAAFRTTLTDRGLIPTKGLQRLVREHPHVGAHHARLAIRCMNEGRFRAARRHFEDALELDPEDSKAILGLACILDRCGALQEAIAQLERAGQHRPNDPAILFALGFCQEKDGRIDEAEETYSLVLEEAPQLRNGYERLAAICLRKGDVSGAIRHYEQLCWLEPGNIDFALALANLHMKAGHNDEAIRRYQFALTMDPDAWPLQGEAGAYVEAGLFEEAIEHLRGLIQDDPDRADNHMHLGDLFARLGRSSEALDEYSEALRLNPDYLEAQVRTGTMHLRQGAYRQAAEAFCHAIELNDRLLTAYVGLGVAQWEAGKEEDALASMAMAASVEPNSTVLFGEMARLQLRAAANQEADKQLSQMVMEALGRPNASPARELVDEQIRRHEAAIRKHPRYADLHYRLGMLLRHGGRLEEAIAAFERALEINPNYVKALIKLGLAYRESGQDERAIEVFRRALDIQPRAVEVHYQLGLIFADREQFRLAVEQFEHAVRRDPTNVEFRANLALALQDMGMLDRAQATWQSLCELAPSTQEGRDMLIRIGRRD